MFFCPFYSNKVSQFMQGSVKAIVTNTGRDLGNVYHESLKSIREIKDFLLSFVLTLQQQIWMILFSIVTSPTHWFSFGVTALCRPTIDLKIWHVFHFYSVPGNLPEFFSLKLLSVSLLDSNLVK